MKSNLFRAVSLMAVLSLAALACGLSIPGLSGSGSLYEDDFENSASGWGTTTDSDKSVEYVDGGLLFAVYIPKYLVYSTPNFEQYENVHVEVDAKNTSSDPKAAFGIICNQQATRNAYYFGYVTASGVYGIARSRIIEGPVDLTSGSSDLISANVESYRLGLDCGNGRITLYVNGQQVATVEDAEFTSGYVALFAWSDELPSSTSVAYDNFVVTTLP